MLAAGEEMKASYNEDVLCKMPGEGGFLIFEHLNAAQMTERFFAEHDSAQPLCPMRAPEGVGYVPAVKE